MPLHEGDELTGENGKTYLAVSNLGQDNVWTAVDSETSKVVVVKEPDANDASNGAPGFQNEMVMHELLKDSPAIRQQIDRISPNTTGGTPMLVLEIADTTLWGARTKRPFTLGELKHVTKDALIGLRDVHAQGLVYADLKMQNIMIDGFDPKVESDPEELHASLGDLGIVMQPAKGTVQPVSYRAPEVYFKGDITPKADIWGWGLIYCHLLEARKQFSTTGLYDASGTLPEREQQIRTAIANDYKLQGNPSYSGVALPRPDSRKGKGDQWERLRDHGLEDGEVDFLRWVLRADPLKRPSATQILQSGWLDRTEDEVKRGFVPPENGIGSTGRASLEFDPREARPEEVRKQEMLRTPTRATFDIPPSPR
jgi:protein kinase